jgi:hypothetical protein
MALDYNYTSNFDEHPNERGVYHVVFMCPEARKIKEGNRVYAKPPSSENRRPCEVCLSEIGAWLKTV